MYILSEVIPPNFVPWTLTYVTVDSSLNPTTAYEIDLDTSESRFLFNIPPAEQVLAHLDIDAPNLDYAQAVLTISPDRNFYIQTLQNEEELVTVLVNITTNERYRLPSSNMVVWSPNSDYIAYDFRENNQFRIYAQAISIDAPPHDPMPISDPQFIPQTPIWSQDGQYIAFRQVFSETQQQDVVVVQVESGETFRITDIAETRYPVFWTADSQYIAYYCRNDICLSDLSGEIVQRVPMPEVGFYEDVEAWSVHNDVIAVISNDNASFRPVQLTLISLDRKLRLHFILEPLQALARRYWSPDVRRYALVEGRRNFYATDGNLQTPHFISDEIFRIIE